MTNEQKSKVIHEALFPDECWHEWDYVQGWSECNNCGHKQSRVDKNPNYFANDLPDNVRVAMVTAAGNKFGLLLEGKIEAYHRTTTNWLSMPIVYAIPTAVIAEAIYKLIEEQNDGK